MLVSNLCKNFQKTLPTFPSASQSQLKLLNMGNSPLTVNLTGVGPIDLPASQVRPRTKTHWTFIKLGIAGLKFSKISGMQSKIAKPFLCSAGQ